MKIAQTASKKTPVLALSHGVGRRKSSVARVWFKKGTGAFMVNGKTKDGYFDTPESRTAAGAVNVLIPHLVSGIDVQVNVVGGGMCSQADAVRLAIARALGTLYPEALTALRLAGFLTVDARVKERKKYGLKAARRGFQFVKR
jgi:small subunit ribosomal protein S9